MTTAAMFEEHPFKFWRELHVSINKLKVHVHCKHGKVGNIWMNNNTIIEISFRMTWRIMQIDFEPNNC